MVLEYYILRQPPTGISARTYRSVWCNVLLSYVRKSTYFEEMHARLEEDGELYLRFRARTAENGDGNVGKTIRQKVHVNM